MRKINLTLFPVPKKYGMMESPQIDIAQLFGDLKSIHSDDVSMNDYRFLGFKQDLKFLDIFNSTNLLLNGIFENSLQLELGCRDFYKYFEPIIGDNEIFIFPISVLEQFRIEYLLPALLFSFFFKKEFINKKIIFFGNCPISHAKKIIEKFSFIDAIVLNGDNIALKKYINGDGFENIIYREGNNLDLIIGKINHSVDISSYSTPNYDCFDLIFYKKRGNLVLPYELSRGCKNSCFFCYYIHKGGKVYKKDIIKVINDLSYIKEKYKTNLFHFHDAEINFDNEYLNKLCDEIIENKLNIFWSALAISKDLNDVLLQKLYKAGCRQLRFGIESGSQRLLDIIGKGTNNIETIEILKNCSKIGISTYATFIVDLPQETSNDLKSTLNFIKKNREYLNDIQMCSYGELGNFPIDYLKNLGFPNSLDKMSKKKILFERFQYNLGIKKGDIVEFIRNF